METATVGDIDIHYQLFGEGPPLVMIMGLTATMDWWDPRLLDALSENHRILMFDNRAAGRTEAPPGELSIRQLADDTAGLMDAVGFSKADIVGVSMGGMIAQELVLNYPEKVNKLVLCVTYPGGANTVIAEREVLQKLADRSGTTEQLVRRFLSIIFPEQWLKDNEHYFDDFMERYLRAPTTEENAQRQFMATVRHDAYDRLPSIQAPTLVVSGSEDILIPPENSMIIAERIPNAELVEIEGGGHGCVHQCLDEILEVLTGFLG